MTSKELVHRAIAFESPPCIPRSSSRPERFDSDTLRIFTGRPAGFTPGAPRADEWGCIKEKNIEGQAGFPVVNPLANWDNWDDYVFPDPYAKGRFDHIAHLVAQKDPRLSEQFVYTGIGPGPLTLASFLLGFENFLLTMAADPERIAMIVAAHHKYMLGLAEQIAAYDCIDAVFFWDDSAMQTGPFFSMDMWRAFFKTPLRELCACIHAGGQKVLMHSCGNLKEHIAELHECGVDILDSKQPLLYLDAARAFRGKITFHSCLDYTVFARLPREQLTAQIEDLIRALSGPAGGFIGTLNIMIDPGVPTENIDAAWEAYRAFRWRDQA
ncbi:MAG: hypothetical protein K9N49_07270 [Candidatus Marinimicrobia bacterium]|nr:hypothetical protein [Candidatus Neomarinimicrobiota bacterium]